MILVLKKIACAVVIFCCLFGIRAAADEEFLVFGEDNKQISQVLNMSQTELEKYCEDNKITYLAVNADNTKQIRRSEFADAFSQKVTDLSVLGDKEILRLADSLTGFSDVKGEIIKRNALKFLKVELETEDDGGKYVLTQYLTVQDGQKTVLTFYTADGVDRDYIQSAFEKQFPEKFNYKPFIIIGIILFAFVSVIVAVLVIKEIRKKED